MPDLFETIKNLFAIDALRERVAITKPEFLQLDAANRSRAFTMARISDLSLLQNIHDELSIAINDGETFNTFLGRLDDLKERSGWTGTSPWHYRVVYDMNMGMAYSAGRVQQATESGISAWRYLPSISATPRPEHEQYYNQVYRFAPGTPVPPIDFGCNCGWEIVTPDELESMGIDPATLPIFNPPTPKSGFVWSASDYFNLSAAVAANSEVPEQDGCRLIAHAAIEAVPPIVRTWFEESVRLAATIAQDKFARAADLFVAASRIPLTTLRDSLTFDSPFARKLLAALRDEDEQELMHQATLAALLEGRLTTAQKVRRET